MPAIKDVGRVRLLTGAAIVASALVAGCTGSSKHPSSSGSSGHVSATPTAPSTSVSESDRATGTPSKASPNPAVTASSLPVQTTAPTVPLTATGNFGGQVTGSIVGVKTLTAKAVQPGEVSGPALAVTIQLVNGSGKAINLNNAVVNLAYGTAAAPGGPMSGPPAQPLPQSLAAGKSATAVYVFTVTKQGQTGPITVQVSYSPLAPIVVFSGTA